MPRPRELAAAAWDAVVGSDPGLLRLRTGAIAALSVSLAVLVLAGLATLQGRPVTTELLGVVVAMMSSSLVRETNRRDRLITSVLLPLAAGATVTTAALLAPYGWVPMAVIVPVMFGAAYIRRFDIRGTAVGMIAFISYFYTLFLHAGSSQLVTLISAVVIGTCCSVLVREFILPERDTAVLARLLRAFRSRVGSVLDATRTAIQDGTLDDHADRRLRIRLRRLNETAQLVEDRVERAGHERLWRGPSNETLALRVFDLELATEEVALTSARLLSARTVPPEEERRRLARLLGVLRRSVREDAGLSLNTLAAAERLTHAAEGRPAAPLVKAIQMTVRAISALRPDAADVEPEAMRNGEVPDSGANRPTDRSAGHTAGLLADPTTSHADGDTDTDRTADGADGPDATTGRPRRRWPELLPTTRQAIQTAVAGGLAIAIGNSISPERWYWAALTAFVVFIGTSSRGETLSRGGQRLFGTLGGVVAGVVVAAPASGHLALSLALVVVCVFLAFYLQRVAHGLQAFFITVLLALMYGLIGQFSVEVLALRLEETAIGVVCGMLASYLILPISTRATIQDKLADFARQLGELIDQVADVLCGLRPGDGLIAAARDLDAATSALRLAARPLSHGMAGLGGRRSFRRWVRAARACDQYARELAQVCHPLGWQTPAPATLQSGPAADALRLGCERIRGHLGLLGTALTNPPHDPLDSAAPLFDDVTAQPSGPPPDRALRNALHYLTRIDQTMLAALDNNASERLDQAHAR